MQVHAVKILGIDGGFFSYSTYLVEPTIHVTIQHNNFSVLTKKLAFVCLLTIK